MTPYRESPRVVEAQGGGTACFYCGCVVQAGAASCPSCMAEAERAPSTKPTTCRRCGGSFVTNTVGQGCTRCGGIFLCGDDWDRIVAAIRSDAAIDHATIVPPPPGSAPKVDLLKHVSCACCGQPMERTAFAARSAFTVDVCPRHGLWLDSGELVGVIEHVRRLWKEKGGRILTATEQREAMAEQSLLKSQIDADAEKRRLERLARGERDGGFGFDFGGSDSDDDD